MKFFKKFPNIWSSLILSSFYNFAFFGKFYAVYPFSSFVFVSISVYLVLTLVIFLVLQLINFRAIFKSGLIILFFVSALCSYFVDRFGIPVDRKMMDNIVNTDHRELMDLFTLALINKFIFLGALPIFFIYRMTFSHHQDGFWKQLRLNAKNFTIALSSILLLIFLNSKFYASFFREHKELRYFTNPTFPIYSVVQFAFSNYSSLDSKISIIGTDAIIPETDTQRDLIIMVLGETARSERFSLNGYYRDTNSLLSKEKVISFSNFFSCGTSTAESLPCLFSNFGVHNYKRTLALKTENILDVLKHTHEVNILWRDNNSDSKGVALRVKNEDFRTPALNPECDEECRDVGMLSGLQKFVDDTKEKDILIVLHQMGSHGPAYYKRYPAAFEKFTPACHTKELSECTLEEINNAYDNTIVYTDYFLSQVIKFLKMNSKKFETAMLYVSDHGESLGENGIYLHSLPNMIAPVEQRKIPAIFWFGDSILEDIDVDEVKKISHERYTHDNIFHTLLGLFEVETKLYDSRLDLVHHKNILNTDKGRTVL
ncbi:MAG: phosphoethanolamine--lipid A transferase [Bacteriovoracaceae bacterium]|nr:phosphoethanolamine--lipid A transferase [Bacteriovoracaceae bacterium]